uniref:Putative ovule protein n=1 Tax=Solanum chacoense TaxID=4108 RepID=A0A0V0HFJ6_SOLCH
MFEHRCLTELYAWLLQMQTNGYCIFHLITNRYCIYLTNRKRNQSLNITSYFESNSPIKKK